MTNTTKIVSALNDARDYVAAARADEQVADLAARRAEGFRSAAENIVYALEHHGLDAARAYARERAEAVLPRDDRQLIALMEGWAAAGNAALETFLA